MMTFIGGVLHGLGVSVAQAATPFSIEEIGGAIYDCFGPISVWQPWYAAVPVSVLWLIMVVAVRNRQPKTTSRIQWLIILIAPILNTILGFINLGQGDPVADYFKGSGCHENMRNWFLWIPFAVLYAIAFFFLSRIKRSPVVAKHLAIVSILLVLFHVAVVIAASVAIEPFPPK